MHQIEMTKQEQRGLGSSGKRQLRNLNSYAAEGNQSGWDFTVKSVRSALEQAERELARAEENLAADPKNERMYQRTIDGATRRVNALRRLMERI